MVAVVKDDEEEDDDRASLSVCPPRRAFAAASNNAVARSMQLKQAVVSPINAMARPKLTNRDGSSFSTMPCFLCFFFNFFIMRLASSVRNPWHNSVTM